MKSYVYYESIKRKKLKLRDLHASHTLELTAPIFSLFFSLFWVPFSKLLKIRLYWFVEFASSLHHKRKHKTDGSVTKVVILRVD